jgi:hypothetical protein
MIFRAGYPSHDPGSQAPYAERPIILYSHRISGLKLGECGIEVERMGKNGSPNFDGCPSYTPHDAVEIAETMMEIIAASSNGDAKNALARCAR